MNTLGRLFKLTNAQFINLELWELELYWMDLDSLMDHLINDQNLSTQDPIPLELQACFTLERKISNQWHILKNYHEECCKNLTWNLGFEYTHRYLLN